MAGPLAVTTWIVPTVNFAISRPRKGMYSAIIRHREMMTAATKIKRGLVKRIKVDKNRNIIGLHRMKC